MKLGDAEHSEEKRMLQAEAKDVRWKFSAAFTGRHVHCTFWQITEHRVCQSFSAVKICFDIAEAVKAKATRQAQQTETVMSMYQSLQEGCCGLAGADPRRGDQGLSVVGLKPRTKASATVPMA